MKSNPCNVDLYIRLTRLYLQDEIIDVLLTIDTRTSLSSWLQVSGNDGKVMKGGAQTFEVKFLVWAREAFKGEVLIFPPREVFMLQPA